LILKKFSFGISFEKLIRLLQKIRIDGSNEKLENETKNKRNTLKSRQEYQPYSPSTGQPGTSESRTSSHRTNRPSTSRTPSAARKGHSGLSTCSTVKALLLASIF